MGFKGVYIARTCFPDVVFFLLVYTRNRLSNYIRVFCSNVLVVLKLYLRTFMLENMCVFFKSAFYFLYKMNKEVVYNFKDRFFLRAVL